MARKRRTIPTGKPVELDEGALEQAAGGDQQCLVFWLGGTRTSDDGAAIKDGTSNTMMVVEKSGR